MSPRCCEKIERVRQHRRHKFYLRDERITLSHGSGGKATHNLIEGVFAPAFANPLLDRMDDSAMILDCRFWIADLSKIHKSKIQNLAFTTDTYVVSPLFFPGGDIGKLAVHGTVNDLAMAGAQPLYLSAGFILEEGFAIADLRRIVDSDGGGSGRGRRGDRHRRHQGGAARQGRWRVHQHRRRRAGQADWPIGQAEVRPGDKVLLSGSVGDHGIAIMLAREALELETDVQSDTAPLHTLVAALMAAVHRHPLPERPDPRRHCDHAERDRAGLARSGSRLTNMRSRCIPACAAPARSWGLIR